jgi:hypothetical protein
LSQNSSFQGHQNILRTIHVILDWDSMGLNEDPLRGTIPTRHYWAIASNLMDNVLTQTNAQQHKKQLVCLTP